MFPGLEKKLQSAKKLFKWYCVFILDFESLAIVGEIHFTKLVEYNDLDHESFYLLRHKLLSSFEF